MTNWGLVYLFRVGIIIVWILSLGYGVHAQSVANKDLQKSSYTISFVPFVEHGTQRETTELTPSSTSVIGGAIALSKEISSEFSVGGVLSYTLFDNVDDFLTPGFTKPGRLGSESYVASFYTEFSKKNFTIKPTIRGGIDDYELERPDVTTGLVAFSQSRGWNIGTQVEASVLLPLPGLQGIFLQPLGDIDYSFFTAREFTETGAGPSNLAFDRVNDTRVVGQLGLGLVGVIPHRTLGLIAPYASVKYRRNFITGPIQTNAALASGLLNFGEVALLPGQEANGIAVDAGLLINGTNRLDLAIVYSGQFFQTSSHHLGSAELKISF